MDEPSPRKPNYDGLGLGQNLSESEKEAEAVAPKARPAPEVEAKPGIAIIRWLGVALFLSVAWCGYETSTWFYLPAGLMAALIVWGTCR